MPGLEYRDVPWNLPAMVENIPKIAAAAAADEADWLALWGAYLRFYKTHLPDGITRATWRDILSAA